MGILHAQDQIDRIASAIEIGDLEAANIALDELRPLLVSDKIEELKQLKAQIDQMTLQVRRHRTEVNGKLAKLSNQRNAIRQYQVMGDLPAH